jgi:hypothetical protein
VLEALRAQALRAADALQTRVSGHAQTFIAAFPGPTVINAECAAFAAEVNQRLIPEVTQQVVRRKAQRWLQACGMARESDEMFVREAATSPASARAVETAAAEVTAPTDSRFTPEEAGRVVRFRAKLDGGAKVPTSLPETVAPAQASMSARGWEDVEIRFLSDFTFQAVVNGTVLPPQNYAEMGFGDGRHGRPKAAWDTLRALAESGGVFQSTQTAAAWPKLEKRIQEIRRLLRAHFNLPGDPVPYRPGGYRTRFRIRLSRSYEQ